MNPAIHAYNYKVDFSEIEHFIEIHEVLKRDLEFPDYCEGNLDALRDRLTDMLGGINHIVIYGFDNTLSKHPDYNQKILSIFKDTKHAYGDKFCDRFFVTVIHEDGSREEIR